MHVVDFMSGLEEGVARIDGILTQMDKTIDSLNHRVDDLRTYMLTFFVVTWTFLGAILAKLWIL